MPTVMHVCLFADAAGPSSALGPDDQARLHHLLSLGSDGNASQLSPTSLPSAAHILTTTGTAPAHDIPLAAAQQPVHGTAPDVHTAAPVRMPPSM